MTSPFAQLLQRTPGIVSWIKSRDGRFVWISPNFEAEAGFNPLGQYDYDIDPGWHRHAQCPEGCVVWAVDVSQYGIWDASELVYGGQVYGMARRLARAPLHLQQPFDSLQHADHHGFNLAVAQASQ